MATALSRSMAQKCHKLFGRYALSLFIGSHAGHAKHAEHDLHGQIGI
jgi:hypothetical protein